MILNGLSKFLVDKESKRKTAINVFLQKSKKKKTPRSQTSTFITNIKKIVNGPSKTSEHAQGVTKTQFLYFNLAPKQTHKS